jgi:hypothetical protein
VRFPVGSLPARGFRCPRCGEAILLAAEAEALEAMARRLGLYGVEDRRRRKLLRTGGSLAVTLDPELLRAALGAPGAGATVEVGRQGDSIVIRRTGSESEP